MPSDSLCGCSFKIGHQHRNINSILGCGTYRVFSRPAHSLFNASLDAAKLSEAGFFSAASCFEDFHRVLYADAFVHHFAKSGDHLFRRFVLEGVSSY